MTRSRTTWRASLALAAVGTAALGFVAPASAATNPSDPTFVPNAASSSNPDFVGVGSDTSQVALHYIAEGYTPAGGTRVPGWNDAHADGGRIASFAADGDSSVVLRDGSAAVTRPNNSGTGRATLYTPAPAGNADVSFARSSSALGPADASAGLQAFPFAVDGLKLAVKATGSDAPNAITAADMVKIYDGTYDTWNDIPGNAGGSTNAIHPLIPFAGSGTRTVFEAQLKSANNGNSVTIAGTVKTVQEHSDAELKADPDAIAPFSTGRAKALTTIKLVDGTTADNKPSFSSKRALYNVLRGADASKDRFLAVFGPNGFICSKAAAPLIAAAGFEQLAPSSQGGVCGVPTQGTTSNFLTAEEADASQATTTGLTAVGAPNHTVRLTATVDPSTAEGSVEFSEGSNKVATVPVTDGEATTTLEGVEAGQHSYKAVFVPTDATKFLTSSTETVTATVADAKYDDAIDVSAPSTTWGATKNVVVTIAEGGNNATGDVTLFYGESGKVTGTLSGGKATLALPATLAVGTYWGAVEYAGDANFAKDYNLVKLTVTKATTKTSLKLAASKVKVKKATKGTVTVTINGTSQKANGKVTLKIGSTTVGTGTVKNGKATVTIKAQTKTGKKTVKATFTPSSSNYGSSSATATYTVVK